MHKQLLELTIQGIKRKKKTSLLIFLILLISFSFAISALSITESIDVSNTDYRLDTYGAWEYAVYGGDRKDEKAYRKLQETAQMGTAVCYGTVMANAVYGTLDPALKEMGHLRLQDGRFPTQSDEIAIEADILNALGCSYVLGQSIRLQIALPAVPAGQTAETADAAQGNAVIVEKTYRLCGVICDYTDLWENGQGRLPGAVVTEEEALHVYADAAKQYETAVLETPEYQYFFRATKNVRTLQKALLQHPFFAENGNSADRRLVFNSAAFDTAQETGSYYFYLGMIFCVTLLAVFYVYLSQMEREVRHLALFRSIGITEKQLRIKLFYETLCLVLPAVLAGLLAAWGVIVLVQHSLLLVHTRKIHIHIPVLVILGLVLLWFAGVLLVRFLLFQAALRQPLRGRMQTDRRKKRRYRRVSKALLLMLSGIVCATLIFSCMQAAWPWMLKEYAESDCSYRFLSTETTAGISGRDFAAALAQLPGVRRVNAWAAFYGGFHLEENTDAGTNKDEAASDKDSETDLEIYGLAAADWEVLVRQVDGGADMDALQRGDAVILVVPENRTGKALPAVSQGDTLFLDLYGDPETGETSYYVPGRKREQIRSIPVKVGAVVHNVNDYFTRASELFRNMPYGIVCPLQLLDEALQDTGIEQEGSQYLKGGAYGCTQGEVYTDGTADYYSTDYAMAELCERYGYHINTFREENTGQIQRSLQMLVQLLASGAVILCVSLLLICSSQRLADEGETKRIAVLRALGLSRCRLRLQVLLEAAGTALFSVGAGWGAFGVYLLYGAFRQQSRPLEYFGEAHTLKETLMGELNIYRNYGIHSGQVLLVSAAGAALVALTVLLARRRLPDTALFSQSRRKKTKDF